MSNNPSYAPEMFGMPTGDWVTIAGSVNEFGKELNIPGSQPPDINPYVRASMIAEFANFADGNVDQAGLPAFIERARALGPELTSDQGYTPPVLSPYRAMLAYMTLHEANAATLSAAQQDSATTKAAAESLGYFDGLLAATGQSPRTDLTGELRSMMQGVAGGSGDVNAKAAASRLIDVLASPPSVLGQVVGSIALSGLRDKLRTSSKIEQQVAVDGLLAQIATVLGERPPTVELSGLAGFAKSHAGDRLDSIVRVGKLLGASISVTPETRAALQTSRDAFARRFSLPRRS